MSNRVADDDDNHALDALLAMDSEGDGDIADAAGTKPNMSLFIARACAHARTRVIEVARALDPKTPGPSEQEVSFHLIQADQSVTCGDFQDIPRLAVPDVHVVAEINRPRPAGHDPPQLQTGL